MAQRYLLPELPPAGEATLTGDIAHHLGRVLRVRPGATLRLGDGRGRTADATVTANQPADRRVVVEIGPHAVAARPTPQVTVAFACPRPARVDWLVEHGTEVGIAVFQPLWTERSRPQSLRAPRWRKIAAAAAGQCDRAWLPDVREPAELTDYLTASDLPQRRLVADAAGAPAASDDRRATVLLVGPEGGFSPVERDVISAAGFEAVRYGPHTLRTETAAVVGAALLMSRA